MSVEGSLAVCAYPIGRPHRTGAATSVGRRNRLHLASVDQAHETRGFRGTLGASSGPPMLKARQHACEADRGGSQEGQGLVHCGEPAEARIGSRALRSRSLCPPSLRKADRTGYHRAERPARIPCSFSRPSMTMAATRFRCTSRFAGSRPSVATVPGNGARSTGLRRSGASACRPMTVGRNTVGFSPTRISSEVRTGPSICGTGRKGKCGRQRYVRRRRPLICDAPGLWSMTGARSCWRRAIAKPTPDPARRRTRCGLPGNRSSRRQRADRCAPGRLLSGGREQGGAGADTRRGCRSAIRQGGGGAVWEVAKWVAAAPPNPSDGGRQVPALEARCPVPGIRVEAFRIVARYDPPVAVVTAPRLAMPSNLRDLYTLVPKPQCIHFTFRRSA